jgi:mitochondrial import receptor subunit TOM40
MAAASEAKESFMASLQTNALSRSLLNTYQAFSEKRDALGLPNPGKLDNIASEVQRDVFLTNYTFTGLRADLTKGLSMNPLFQISHAFSIGSQGLPPYTFAVLYGTNKVCRYRDIIDLQ